MTADTSGRRRAVQAARAAGLATHCAAGLAVGHREAERLLRVAEGCIRTASAALGAAPSAPVDGDMDLRPSTAVPGSGTSKAARRRRKKRLATAGGMNAGADATGSGKVAEVMDVDDSHGGGGVEEEPAAGAALGQLAGKGIIDLRAGSYEARGAEATSSTSSTSQARKRYEGFDIHQLRMLAKWAKLCTTGTRKELVRSLADAD